jgi:hypothetical protein
MPHERRAGLGAAGHHVDHASWQDIEATRQAQTRERVLVRRLADERVSGGQRRRHLPRHQEQREVERHDRRDDAERLLDREVDLVRRYRRDRSAVAPPAHFRVVIEARGDPLDAVDRFDQRLPGLARHEGGELALVGTDLRGHGAQQAGLLDTGHPPPGGLGARGGLDRGGHVVRSAVVRDSKEVERGGVPDVAGGTGAGGDPGAVDQDGGDVGHGTSLLEVTAAVANVTVIYRGRHRCT